MIQIEILNLLIILVKTLTELYYCLDSTRIEKELDKKREYNKLN